MEHIYQIFDKIFKRIFSLSNLAIINLINGLFGTNYPLDSEVTYPNKEFVNAAWSKRFADLFITINGRHTYHLEAQMKTDETIVIRVFEYSFYHAIEHRANDQEIYFPEPMVIYLSEDSNVPEKSVLKIHFGTQDTYEFEVRNYIYLKHDVVELNQKKMVILIPFQLLKLRKLIQKDPSEKNFLALQKLIQDDILGSIEANLRVGNITPDDANQLVELTKQLYEYIYQHYEDLGGAYPDMKPLLYGAMELPLDKYRIRIDELEQKNAEHEREKAEHEREKAEHEREKAEHEREKAELEQEKANIEKEKVKAEQEKIRAEQEKARALENEKKLQEEISRLKKQLEERN